MLVRLESPPMRTRPAGDCQLECWNLRWRRLWLTTQPPARAENLAQERRVSVPEPPQLSSPSWVWCRLAVGSGGMVQEMGVPAPDNTSTEARPVPYHPPVTMMAEIRFTYEQEKKFISKLVLVG